MVLAVSTIVTVVSVSIAAVMAIVGVATAVQMRKVRVKLTWEPTPEIDIPAGAMTLRVTNKGLRESTIIGPLWRTDDKKWTDTPRAGPAVWSESPHDTNILKQGAVKGFIIRIHDLEQFFGPRETWAGNDFLVGVKQENNKLRSAKVVSPEDC